MEAGPKNKSASKPSFEESLKRLEEILELLESSNVSLDELVSKYAEAKKLLADCRKALDKAQLSIKKFSDEKGLEDFDL